MEKWEKGQGYVPYEVRREEHFSPDVQIWKKLIKKLRRQRKRYWVGVILVILSIAAFGYSLWLMRYTLLSFNIGKIGQKIVGDQTILAVVCIAVAMLIAGIILPRTGAGKEIHDRIQKDVVFFNHSFCVYYYDKKSRRTIREKMLFGNLEDFYHNEAEGCWEISGAAEVQVKKNGKWISRKKHVQTVRIYDCYEKIGKIVSELARVYLAKKKKGGK